MTEVEQPRSKALVEQRQIYTRIHGAAAIAFASIKDRSIELRNEVVDAKEKYDIQAYNSIHEYAIVSGMGPNGLRLADHYCYQIAEGVKEDFEESLRNTGE